MRRTLLFILAALMLLASQPVAAQSSGPIYIVQPGDTLSSIAARFNVTLDALMTANNITDPNILSAGQQLVIPGLEGVTGILDTEVITFGDSLRSLVRRTQMPLPLLEKLNRLISPSELYVGASLIVPKQEDGTVGLSARAVPQKGETLLEVAVRQGSDPWTMASLNGLAGTWDALPGDSLYSVTGSTDTTTSGLPDAFVSAQIKALPLKQGGTAEIIVQAKDGVTLGGMLVDHPLHFFPLGDGSQVALQGIDVLLPTGAYPLRLDATLPDGSTQAFEQMVLVARGDQRTDEQPVPPVDPAEITSEDDQVGAVASAPTPTKYWTDPFILPVALPYCITEWFGTPRYFTYNGSEAHYYHSGVDYGPCSPEHPLDIYAAAPGKVVFTGTLVMRGNATIIDNGWGVYTLYAHQKEIYVSVGQDVEAGQVIGQIGATGHVTGPHLHFEMWVGDVLVNPLDWLNAPIP